MSKFLYHFIIVTCIIYFVGCAGGRGNIKMENLKYPASMSAFLYGTDNEILAKNKELEIVESFEYKKIFWSILYNAVSLSNDKDIADAINKKIEESDGGGIINLSVTSSGCALNDLFYWTFLHLLPITPGCVDVTVTGEIVKLSMKKSSSLTSPLPYKSTVINNFIPKDKIEEVISKTVLNDLK